MKIVNAIDSVIDIFEKYVCIALLVAMTICILIQIVLRMLSFPLSWTEELARYLFVWSIYISASLAARYDKHLKVDILNVFVKERGQYIFTMISNIIAIIFFVILAFIMVEVLAKFGMYKQTSASLKIDMRLVYAAPFVCSILTTVRYLENIIRSTTEYLAWKKGNGHSRKEVA